VPDPSLSTAGVVAPLAAALGCGLLIGIERERRKGSGPERELAGVRSFALVCVLGAVSTLWSRPWLTVVGALFVAALGVVAYARDKSDDPGVTTEVALLLTYLIGVLCTWSIPLAAGLAAGLTVLLAAREHMHHFALHWLRPGELRDGVLLAALVLIALPLVPDRPLWGPVLNAHVIVRLLALLLAIQALAHLSRRLLEARRAMALSALASGFVSSTATIASLGIQVRDGRAAVRPMAGAALVSCVATMLQLLAVAAAVQPAWLQAMWLPCTAGAMVAALWGRWLLAHDAGADASRLAGTAADAPGTDTRMFSLSGAALVAALLAGVQVAVYALERTLGDGGLLAGTLLASLLDLHAATAAVLVQGPPPAGGGSPTLLVALMAALGTHAASKTVTAALSGGRRYALQLAPGLWLHTAACVAALWGVDRWG
jgi:uncharacterized membrane protein (DUF4010 family)